MLLLSPAVSPPLSLFPAPSAPEILGSSETGAAMLLAPEFAASQNEATGASTNSGISATVPAAAAAAPTGRDAKSCPAKFVLT